MRGEAEPVREAPSRVLTGTLARTRRGRRVQLVERVAEPREPVVRPARVARLLALAHALEGAIARGEFADRADVARELGFTRARVSQICDLTLLAPDLQEEVLALVAVDGVEPMSERDVRGVVREREWRVQRRGWGHREWLRSGPSHGHGTDRG